MLALDLRSLTQGHDRTGCELADIFRTHGRGYQMTHPLPASHRKVMSAIVSCRTEYLGGRIERCELCGFERMAYNSCRNRHCPKCQSMAKARWLHARKEELLPVGYFHAVFTLPHELNALVQCNKRKLYGLLFHAVSQTLAGFGSNPRNGLGGKLGFILVLHTWSQVLLDHYHLHCVIPAGALSQDGSRFIASRKRFLFPVRALSKVFRGKFIEMLEEAYLRGELIFPGSTAYLGMHSGFRKLIVKLRSQRWVVYTKKPFAGPEAVLDYLGRYTHRVAISNHRILALYQGKVAFAYKDRTDMGTRKVMKLDAEEFIRRFLLHILPEGFMRIRSYGFLANRSKRRDLGRIREILVGYATGEHRRGEIPTPVLMFELTGIDITRCPSCRKGTMRRIAEIPVGMVTGLFFHPLNRQVHQNSS